MISINLISGKKIQKIFVQIVCYINYYIRHNKTMMGTYCLNLENLENFSSKSSNFGGLLISFCHKGVKICPPKKHCSQWCKFSFELWNVFHISINNNNNNLCRIYNYCYKCLFSFDFLKFKFIPYFYIYNFNKAFQILVVISTFSLVVVIQIQFIKFFCENI